MSPLSVHRTSQKPSDPTHHMVQEQRVDVQGAAIPQTCMSGEPRRCRAWWQLGVAGSADSAGTKKSCDVHAAGAKVDMVSWPRTSKARTACCTVAGGWLGCAYAVLGVCNTIAGDGGADQARTCTSFSDPFEQAHFWLKGCSPAAKGWRCSA